MCTAYGDRHYRTFDGLLFDYVGACKVYLVKVLKVFIHSEKTKTMVCIFLTFSFLFVYLILFWGNFGVVGSLVFLEYKLKSDFFVNVRTTAENRCSP